MSRLELWIGLFVYGFISGRILYLGIKEDQVLKIGFSPILSKTARQKFIIFFMLVKDNRGHYLSMMTNLGRILIWRSRGIKYWGFGQFDQIQLVKNFRFSGFTVEGIMRERFHIWKKSYSRV